VKSRPIDPAALMYHELRAPLGLVATAARSVAGDVEDDDLRQRCEVIVRAAERMLRTAATVASLDAPPGAEERGTFAPVPVVSELVATLQGLGVPIECLLDAPTGALAHGSAERFEALVHSTISNAIDHGAAGETITVEVRQAGGGITVEVSNAVARDDRHAGRGLGTIIAAALARGLDANLDATVADGRYRARIVLPRMIGVSRRPQAAFPSIQSA
jgi:signal transduction histidine kinase